jgi:hypothetical protein
LKVAMGENGMMTTWPARRRPSTWRSRDRANQRPSFSDLTFGNNSDPYVVGTLGVFGAFQPENLGIGCWVRLRR